MEPERCVFGVFFPHTGQHQPHDLVMTQGSMAARWGGLPKPCTAAHRTGCAEDQRPDGGKTGRPMPRLRAAMPMKPRPEIMSRVKAFRHRQCDRPQIDHRHVLHLHGAYDGRQTRFLPADQCLHCATGNSYAVHHLMRRLQHIRQHRSMTNFKMDRFILNSCFVVYISHYCWIWPIGQASFPWPLLLLSWENASAIPAKITSRRIAYSSTAGKSYVCDTQPAQKRKSDMKGERHNVQ